MAEILVDPSQLTSVAGDLDGAATALQTQITALEALKSLIEGGATGAAADAAVHTVTARIAHANVILGEIRKAAQFLRDASSAYSTAQAQVDGHW